MKRVPWLALVAIGVLTPPRVPQRQALDEARWILASVDSTPFVTRAHAAEVARSLRIIRTRYPETRAVRQRGLDLRIAVWVKPESLSWAARVPIGVDRDTLVHALGIRSLDRLGRSLGVVGYHVMNFDADGIVVTPVFSRPPAFLGLAARYRADPAVERVSANHDVLGGATAIFLTRTASHLELTLWDGTARRADGTADVVQYRFSYDRRTAAVRRLES